jgi:ketosteroid isomerase-like protein
VAGETHEGDPFEMPLVQGYTVRDCKLVETRPFYVDFVALNEAMGHRPDTHTDAGV